MRKEHIRIELCGEVASGKTTLAGVLRDDLRFHVVDDRFLENPFWADFHTNPNVACGLEAELTFALLHYNSTRNDHHRFAVCDYSIPQDLSYAKSFLSSTEFLLYSRVYDSLLQDIGYADLTIYLKCPVDEMMRRMSYRGRREDVDWTAERLARCVENLEEQLSAIKNVMIIESNLVDFRNRDRDRLVREIAQRVSTLTDAAQR